MSKEILFEQKENKLIIDNVEIFKYEYPEISENDWNDFVTKPNCQCRGKIFSILKKDQKKLDFIFSKLMNEDVSIIFRGPIEEPIVKEFDDLKQMEEFLKELNRKGKLFRSASPSPNGKGGYVLIVL